MHEPARPPDAARPVVSPPLSAPASRGTHRQGGRLPLGLSRTASVFARDVLEQAPEVGAVELQDGPLVMLHAPFPEVEVDLGDAVLNRGPERPSVLRHEPPEACASGLVSKRPAVVVANELVELLEREVRLAPDVAELEAGVVVARVLVVDEHERATDVDEVFGQEVVVAGDRSFVTD